MIYFEITMEHNRKSFEALAHMQYDLFCKSNRIMRSIVALAAVVFGILHFSEWWGILIVAYGCYLTTSTYSASNHSAHKLSDQVEQSGMGYPKSRFCFCQDHFVIHPLPENTGEQTSISYRELRRLGEDLQNFYLFRDQHGGYLIPKTALEDKTAEFRSFLENATGQKFCSRTAPALKLLNRLSKKRVYTFL